MTVAVIPLPAGTAAERYHAYTAALAAHADNLRDAPDAFPYKPAPELAKKIAATAETLRLAFAAWTSAPDDGTVTPEQLRHARGAGARARSQRFKGDRR